MARRKGPGASEQPPQAAQPNDQPNIEAGDASASAPAAEAETETSAFAPVQAPERAGAAYTIDNILGYRKEDSLDGKRRQIRFAQRPDGERPDDEILAPVRQKKPAVAWAAKEKAWQARKNAEGLEAIDSADQELAEIGRKKSSVPTR